MATNSILIVDGDYVKTLFKTGTKLDAKQLIQSIEALNPDIHLAKVLISDNDFASYVEHHNEFEKMVVKDNLQLELALTILNRFLVTSEAVNLFLLARDAHYVRVFDNFSFFKHKSVYLISNAQHVGPTLTKLMSGCLKLDQDSNLQALSAGLKDEFDRKQAEIQNRIDDLKKKWKLHEAAVAEFQLARDALIRKQKDYEEKAEKEYDVAMKAWKQDTEYGRMSVEEKFWNDSEQLLNHVFKAKAAYAGDESVSESSFSKGTEFTVYARENYDGEDWFSVYENQTQATGYIKHSILRTLLEPVDFQIPQAKVTPQPQKQAPPAISIPSLASVPKPPVDFDVEITRAQNELSEVSRFVQPSAKWVLKQVPSVSLPAQTEETKEIHVAQKTDPVTPVSSSENGTRWQKPLPTPSTKVEQPQTQDSTAVASTEKTSGRTKPLPSAPTSAPVVERAASAKAFSAVDESDPTLSSWIKPRKHRDGADDSEPSDWEASDSSPAPATRTEESKKWAPPSRPNRKAPANPQKPTTPTGQAPSLAKASTEPSFQAISETSTSDGVVFGDVFVPSSSDKRKLFENLDNASSSSASSSARPRPSAFQGPALVVTGPPAPTSKIVMTATGYADPEFTKYDIKEIRNGTAAHMDPSRKIEYLTDEQFREVFGISYNQFTKLNEFKRNQLLKDKGLE